MQKNHIGRYMIAVVEWNHQEIDRQLKKHFTHHLADSLMLIEILYELTAIKDTSVVTSKQVLAWDRCIYSQRKQITILYSLTENKEL